MAEQFIPRKQRHKKQFFNGKLQNEDREKISIIHYLKCFIYYFLQFIIIGLIHIYLDQFILHKSFKLLSTFEIVQVILICLIYFINYLCIIDTYVRFIFLPVFVRNLLPAFAFILSIIYTITIIKPFI